MKKEIIDLLNAVVNMLKSLFNITVIAISWILRTLKKGYRSLKDRRPEDMPEWQFNLWFPFFTTCLFVVLLSFVFPPPANGWQPSKDLPNGEINWNEDELSFTPKMPNRPKRFIELPRFVKNQKHIENKSNDVLLDGTDLDKLAFAVAMAETANCTRGFGKDYNNCFGIKNGNTAPCAKIGRNRMCIYEEPNESYEAFKKIWGKWYGRFPDYKLARKWTSGDNVHHWLTAVKQYYNI